MKTVELSVDDFFNNLEEIITSGELSDEKKEQLKKIFEEIKSLVFIAQKEEFLRHEWDDMLYSSLQKIKQILIGEEKVYYKLSEKEKFPSRPVSDARHLLFQIGDIFIGISFQRRSLYLQYQLGDNDMFYTKTHVIISS